MANSFINKKVDLTTTDLTTLYTVPNFKSSVVKSLLVSEDAGSGSTITITLELRNFPNDSQASSALGPFDVTSSTQKVDTRARARAVALKIENTSSSQSWKLGTFRLDIQPDGRR